MASNLLSSDPYLSPGERQPRRATQNVRSWESFLKPLASLKLTVVLFALAIFIIFTGTLAQVDQDNLVAVRQYFHSFVAWIDLRIFFPRTWNIGGNFPFPGGWTVGGLLVLNLLAAHGLRFKVQARGKRLFAGLAVIAAGIGVTWFVIHGLDTLDSKMLWNGMKLALASLLGLSVYGLATIDWKRRLEVGFLGAAIVLEAAILGFLLYNGDAVPDDSSMRILWELVQGSIAGLVLLAGCILAFKKRGAIVLIHAGIALMMLNELYVSMTAQEAQMRLKPGQVQNYVDDIRTIEFAVIDPSGKIKDNVVVVPKSILLSGSTVRDDRLPFDIHVDDYYQNADILEPIPKGQLPPGMTGNYISMITGKTAEIPTDHVNPATAGLGLTDIATPMRPGTGTDTDSKVDISTAYVTLLKKGTATPIGTYLVSIGLGSEQPVSADGQSYDIALRFKRHYKPYVVQLLETNKVDYPGTDTPQSFESYIHLVDRSSNFDRDHIHIWMNNPLRYNGETFYQTNFAEDPETGAKYSTLAVVANQGWMIPYVGCMIVAVGLLAHFLTVLTRFLRRRADGLLESGEEGESRQRATVPLAKLAHEPLSNRSPGALVADFFPWIAVAILVGWAWSHAIVPRTPPKAMNFYNFGKLPVMYEGRVKPFDSLARNTLKAISDLQTCNDEDGHEHSAVEWLLEVMTDSDVALNAPVFHIVDPDLRDTLGITAKISKAEEREAKRMADGTSADAAVGKQKAAETDDEKAIRLADEAILAHRKTDRYSIAEFRDGLKEFDKQLKQSQGTEKPEDVSLPDKVKAAVSGVSKRPNERSKRNTTARELSEFAQRLNAYINIKESFAPIELPQLPTAEQVASDPKAADKQLFDVVGTIRQFNKDLMARQVPLSIPVAPKSAPLEHYIVGDQWQPYATAVDLALLSRNVGAEPNPNTISLTNILRAYEKNDVAGFNTAVQQYRDALAAAPPANLQGGKIAKLAFESFFNHFDPFFYGMVLYLVAFIVACVALLGWSKPLNRTAFWLVAMTLILHTAAMIARIYISGRPPVTTLYQAALFIGWAGVGIGLILELVYGLGIGTLAGAFAGFLTLFIAQYLATTGEGNDTFTVMRAVLDTQFWLATHVTCITLGYATTFLAGLLGVVYVIFGFCTTALSRDRASPLSRKLASSAAVVGAAAGGWAIHGLPNSKDLGKTLARMIYGVLCFAIFFSFVGTVLGGLWADNSWGRFWGWDPKENGALIIVIWNALVLHARWDKMIGDRGLAVLAIGGNIAVAWSGFGVNELGAGLHSYGFTQGVAFWLSIFVVSQLALIIVGSMPKRLWRSFADDTATAPT